LSFSLTAGGGSSGFAAFNQGDIAKKSGQKLNIQVVLRHSHFFRPLVVNWAGEDGH
jgi:hypothetical protein